MIRRIVPLATVSMFTALFACSGGGTSAPDGGTGADAGQGSDAGPSCTPAAEYTCTEHFHCKNRAVCERRSSVCSKANQGGTGTCTTESLAMGDPLAPPELGCYATPPAPPAGPALVRLRGCVTTFGLDQDTDNGLEISIYTVADGTEGTPLVTVTSGAAMDILGQSCPDKGAFDTGAENVPTNTPLILKVTDPRANPEFVSTYVFGGVVAADRAMDVDGLRTVTEEAIVIAVTTYQVFPQTAGITAGIEGSDDLKDGMGRGALAGSISDCNGRLIANAVVRIDNMDAQRVVDAQGGIFGKLGFTDGAENPDPARETTNIDGLYAAINIAPGLRTLSLATISEGAETPLATFEVPVFADSVTIFSPQGALE